MKKIIISLLLGTVLLVSCNKENVSKEVSKTPLFVKVEAVHLTGEIITSNVILVR